MKLPQDQRNDQGLGIGIDIGGGDCDRSDAGGRRVKNVLTAVYVITGQNFWDLDVGIWALRPEASKPTMGPRRQLVVKVAGRRTLACLDSLMENPREEQLICRLKKQV